tara:strand:+ start:61 stop:234 length:174 start_codon:yes stop_codon:yes gene_type:complete
MGRTYRRGGDDYNSYGKSLREKRQRGGQKRQPDAHFEDLYRDYKRDKKGQPNYKDYS